MVSAEWTARPELQSLTRAWPPERQILLLTTALGAPTAAAAAWRRWNETASLPLPRLSTFPLLHSEDRSFSQFGVGIL